ncbi:MAG: 4Fe-4S binding protein [Thermoprotei archaeon]
MSNQKTSRKSAFGEVKGHIDALATGFKYFVDPHRMTLDYPAEAMELPKNYRGFFRLVDEKCIGCSLCEIVCPSNAIVMMQLPATQPPTPQAGAQAPARPVPRVKKRPLVDWGMCIFCYFCVDVCPTEAFERSNIHDLSYFEESEYRPTFDGFLKLPESPSQNSKKVVAKLDEKNGIKYEEGGKE